MPALRYVAVGKNVVMGRMTAKKAYSSFAWGWLESYWYGISLREASSAPLPSLQTALV